MSIVTEIFFFAQMIWDIYFFSGNKDVYKKKEKKEEEIEEEKREEEEKKRKEKRERKRKNVKMGKLSTFCG